MTTDLAVRQPIDYQAVLRTLRLDPSRPETQALLLVCQRYGLDPVMRHIVLIDGRPYVTRDGLLHVAHMSGQLGGMEVIEETETDTEWTARVAIHRADMPRPFVYRGRYPRSGGNKRYGPEMAVKVSEVMGLRRAFDVALATVEEQWDATAAQPIDAAPVPTRPPAETPHAVEMDAVEAAIAEAEQAGVPVDAGKARGYAQQSAANARRTVETLRQRIRDHTAGDGPGLPSDPATDEQMDRVVALHAALVTAGADRADLPRTTARRATGGSTDLDDLTCVQADQVTADLTEWLARLTGGGAS